MDIKTLNGTLGEISVIKRLVKEEFEVYTSFNGKGSVDIIAYKPDVDLLIRVEVKSCTQESTTSYAVGTRRIRSNKTENVIHLFDKNRQDVLAIYIVNLDKVIFIDSQKITTKTQCSILKSQVEVLESLSLVQALTN